MSLQKIINSLNPKSFKEDKAVYYEKKEVVKAIQKAYSEGKETVWKAIISKFFKKRNQADEKSNLYGNV